MTALQFSITVPSQQLGKLSWSCTLWCSAMFTVFQPPTVHFSVVQCYGKTVHVFLLCPGNVHFSEVQCYGRTVYASLPCHDLVQFGAVSCEGFTLLIWTTLETVQHSCPIQLLTNLHQSSDTFTYIFF